MSEVGGGDCGDALHQDRGPEALGELRQEGEVGRVVPAVLLGRRRRQEEEGHGGVDAVSTHQLVHAAHVRGAQVAERVVQITTHAAHAGVKRRLAGEARVRIN